MYVHVSNIYITDILFKSYLCNTSNIFFCLTIHYFDLQLFLKNYLFMFYSLFWYLYCYPLKMLLQLDRTCVQITQVRLCIATVFWSCFPSQTFTFWTSVSFNLNVKTDNSTEELDCKQWHKGLTNESKSMSTVGLLLFLHWI